MYVCDAVGQNPVLFAIEHFAIKAKKHCTSFYITFRFCAQTHLLMSQLSIFITKPLNYL